MCICVYFDKIWLKIISGIIKMSKKKLISLNFTDFIVSVICCDVFLMLHFAT